VQEQREAPARQLDAVLDRFEELFIYTYLIYYRNIVKVLYIAGGLMLYLCFLYSYLYQYTKVYR
jgi:hypothetical protein